MNEDYLSKFNGFMEPSLKLLKRKGAKFALDFEEKKTNRGIPSVLDLLMPIQKRKKGHYNEMMF